MVVARVLHGGLRWLVGLLLLAPVVGCGRSWVSGSGSGGGGTTGGSWSSSGPGATGTSGDSAGDSAGESTGPGPQPDVGVPSGCEGLGELRISELVPENATPPQWNPGEKLYVHVTVTNTGKSYSGDFGILMKQGVTGISSKTTFIGQGNSLPAGASATYDLDLDADDSLEPVLQVKITVQVAVLDTQHGGFRNCPNAHLVQFEWPLE